MHLEYHDRAVLKEIKETFKDVIRHQPRLFSRFRREWWEVLELAITPSEREEFRILIKDTRLSEAG